MPAETALRSPLANHAPPILEWQWLGRVPYEDGLKLQTSLVERRREHAITDRLLLLEHPHVITLGTSSRARHVLLDEEQRRLLGIAMFETGRGGDVTYHGPGQLVGYPIIGLEPDRRDLHRYVRDLEEALIRCLADFGVTGERRAGRTGVWVRSQKIAAIGVRVSQGWITSHGFALNITTDLRFFNAIVPCGIVDAQVTSIERCTGAALLLEDVATSAATHVAAVFRRSLQPIPAKTTRKT